MDAAILFAFSWKGVINHAKIMMGVELAKVLVNSPGKKAMDSILLEGRIPVVSWIQLGVKHLTFG